MTTFKSLRLFRTIARVSVVVALCGLAWYVVNKRFPNWAERDSFDTAEAAKLQAANLEKLPPTGNDWPQWRGPNRDGVAPEGGGIRTDWRTSPPKQLWTTPIHGGYSSCVVVNNRVFTQDYHDNQERIVCIDALTGQELWVHSYPVSYSELRMGYASGPRATPTIHDGRIYTVGATGILVCLEAFPKASATPKELWRHDLMTEYRAAVPSWGVACSPLVEGWLVIVQPGGRDGSVVAFDQSSGKEVWKSASNPSGYSSPVAVTAAGVRQIIAITGDAVLGLNPTDGKQFWSRDWRTQHNGNIATPIVVQDWVFASAAYGKGCALWHLEANGSGVDAVPVYFFKGRVMQNHHSSSIHHNGFLYGFDAEELRCVNFRTGEVQEEWVAKNPEGRRVEKGTLTLCGETLIGLTQSGTLFAARANPENFEYLGEVSNAVGGGQTWATPTVVGGRIYLRDERQVVCYEAGR